ncbi:signal peptidase II [Nocardioides humilatus]|uniref:Lipoprotein signal peptidase n=1 Tax=Nocardioides humilatus TaxID=2607660 RepID=A0A5B1LDU9_9ACTN|nr:signal peptidase II [Nocardioides humilatus]KAA1417909.1 signal peptidase II [Nocardioides humilatus]
MQAARGTSVDGSDSGPTDPRRTVASGRAWAVFSLVAVGLYAADQFSKHAAVEHLTGRDDVRVVGEVLQLHLTRNPGAAFSLGTGFTVALSCLAIVATGVVLVVSRRLVDKVWAVALGALLAGITGNLTDRMLRDPEPFRGHVVDFLQLPNWPIFNVADISINIGVGLILIQVFRGIGLDGTRQATKSDTTSSEDSE